MKEMWNPYDMDGAVMPFEEFKSWRELIEHYVAPQNEIAREGGPGDAIQAGEWYLTYSSTLNPPDPLDLFHGDWFMCYVGPDGRRIIYWVVGEREDALRFNIIPPEASVIGTIAASAERYGNPKGGAKDGWGERIYHYKVEIEDVSNFIFLNWKDNPYEVKQ